MAEGGVTARAAGGRSVPSRFLAVGAAPGAAPDPVEAADCGFDALLLACPRPVMAGGSPIPADLARTARQAGLALLLDVQLDRFPIDHRLVSAHETLFELRRQRPVGEVVDPRRPPPPVGEARARLQAPEAERLAPAIGTRLAELVSGGANGFRIRRPEAVDGTLLAQILAPARELDHDLVLVAHTPGVPWHEARALGGFDCFVSSLAWWDGRAPWLAEEYEALRTGAPLLAEVTAEIAARARTAAARERLALLAAGTASGFILPPALMAEAQAAAELLETARRYGGEMRLVAGDGGVTAILRGDHSDLRCAAEAMLLLVDSGNARGASAAGPEAQPAAPFEPEMAAALGAEFQPFRRARGAQPPLAKLEPDEVRLLLGRRSKPVRLARKAGGPKAARAAAAQARVVIEDIAPGVDDGAFAAKRIVGDVVTVEATVYADGHEQLAAELRWRAADQKSWQAARMEELGNDRWRAAFPLTRLGRFEFAVEAWFDRYGGFRRDFRKKLEAGVARPVDAAEGRNLVAAAADRSSGEPGDRLDVFVRRLDRALDAGRDDLEGAAGILLDPELAQLMDDADERPFALLSTTRPVDAERLAARYSSWYELFPRSQADAGGGKRHGTFDDVARRLPQIRAMGFDTLYFPPIHPIGRTHRKGRNNALTAAPEDPGSPYAIGGEEGGHDALHPELGNFEDFRRLVDAARAQGLEIALDFAIQCSPDHPWLAEHPGWFDWRPDGTIKYAENPPKQYEDIVNVDFFNKESIPGLWLALRDVVLFWIGEGVKVFRVDNPHTKPFAFWQWLIADVRGPHPDVIFLSEAFTRPAVMYRLAKIGFSQSYTYFTWRNSKAELTAYITELTTGTVPEFFRPHFFVNTPDINPPWLQAAGRAGFRIRAALAATLSGLFGVYSGFELCESEPVPGKEEYHESEKYEIKPRDWQAPGNIIADIALLNRLRRAYPPLQTHLGVRFYNAWNDQVLYYGKQATTGGEMILVAVSLDPHNPQGADFEVPLWEWGLPDDAAVDVQDLVGGRRFRWSGKMQHLELHPDRPYAIWRIAPRGAVA